MGRALALAVGVCAFSISTFGYQLARGYADDGVALTGNHPAQAETFSSMGNAPLDAPLHMQVRFAIRNQAELDRLLAEQQDPASPRFHKWLKKGEFDQRFGVSAAQTKAVEAWLKSEGFDIGKRTAGSLDFSGTVAQAQQTFAVRIARFGDGSRFANTSDPIIPNRFAGVIGAILGLDNMIRAVPVSQPRISPGSVGTTASSAVVKAPSQLALAENRNSSDPGSGGDYIYNNVRAFGPGDIRAFYDETVAS
ncbi:MAG TPA: protease pro-enzyme activation domain-containing protein, partial [Candidatus Binataceae bacterium]|nr:protease pro-enzyme activation domain-containing protein [Candidatus Binataceae bacterium]